MSPPPRRSGRPLPRSRTRTRRRTRRGVHGHDGLVGGVAHADRAGRPGGRLPVRRHEEPAGARRRWPGVRRPGAVRRQRRGADRAGGQPGGGRRSRGPREARAAAHRRGRGGADHRLRRRGRREPRHARSPIPEAWSAAVPRNVASREDNVAAVLARIELGEGDAGFVYATDAAGSDAVATIEIPADANVRATYAGVVPTISRTARRRGRVPRLGRRARTAGQSSARSGSSPRECRRGRHAAGRRPPPPSAAGPGALADRARMGARRRAGPARRGPRRAGVRGWCVRRRARRRRS